MCFPTALETDFKIINFTNSHLPYHNFDDDLINELPSCIYAGQHQSGVGAASGGSSGLRLNSSNLRHIQQHYLHQGNGMYI